MKTTLKILFALCIGFYVSCETDIPETDTTAPTFSFRITGDGFEHTFTQDDDFNAIRLNLREGASYDILLSGIDQGGVRRVQWELPPDYMDLQTAVNSPWQSSTSGLTRTISFNGDQNDPFNASLFAGTFIAHGDLVFITTYIRVEDFGGENGPPFNVTEATLSIAISPNNQTELINL